MVIGGKILDRLQKGGESPGAQGSAIGWQVRKDLIDFCRKGARAKEERSACAGRPYPCFPGKGFIFRSSGIVSAGELCALLRRMTGYAAGLKARRKARWVRDQDTGTSHGIGHGRTSYERAQTMWRLVPIRLLSKHIAARRADGRLRS